jgi:pimeloyl-ACP methyl ester carboxylesterase
MVDAIASGKSSFAQVAGAFAPRLLHPTHAEDPSILQVLTDMARRIGAAGFARQQAAAMSRQDSRELLKTIRCPALVICGEQDQITPPSLSAETAQLLAGHVDLVQIPECGHMSTLEQPVAVTTAFMKWLRLVDA